MHIPLIADNLSRNFQYGFSSAGRSTSQCGKPMNITLESALYSESITDALQTFSKVMAWICVSSDWYMAFKEAWLNPSLMEERKDASCTSVSDGCVAINSKAEGMPSDNMYYVLCMY